MSMNESSQFFFWKWQAFKDFFFDNFEHSLSQIHPTIMRRQESDAI